MTTRRCRSVLARVVATIVAALSVSCSPAPIDPALDAAVLSDVLQVDPLAIGQVAAVDLNDDGLDEVLVHMRPPNHCGTAGCTLFILRSSADGMLELESRMTITQEVAVASTTTDGWRDLVVRTRGHVGLMQRGADGDGLYPLNPSVAPPADDVDTTELSWTVFD